MSKLIDVDKIEWQKGVFVNPNTDEPLPIIHKIATIEMLRDWQEEVKAIPIPTGATNGDLLLGLLAGQHDKIHPVGNTQMGITLDCEWWNAPYKEVNDESDN